MADIRTATKAAATKARALLAKAGIVDQFTVKVRRFDRNAARGGPGDALGLYRARSQFGGGPIFWINERLPAAMSEAGVPRSKMGAVILDTILHEYGHVIWEYLVVRGDTDPDIAALRDDALDMSTLPAKEAEEEFAENFASAIRSGGADAYRPYREIAARFGALLSKE